MRILGSNLYSAPVVDGTWRIMLGTLPEGTIAKVFTKDNGLQPSYPVVAFAEPAPIIEPEYKAGDANGDETVDVSDVVGIINHLVGKTSDSFNEKNADVNQDGQVLVDDAVGTVEIILNSQK